MRKILLPIDGSESSDRAVRYAIRQTQGCQDIEVHLLNVQEQADDWGVRSFLKTEEIEALQTSHGGDALRSARNLLDSAGVAYHAHVDIGPVAETIDRVARESGCEQIILGNSSHGALVGALFGSVALDLIALTEIPVTVVK